MKKTQLSIICLFLIQIILAQAPQKMGYQSVIRNSSNELVSNLPVGIKISILKDSETGQAVYVETQTTTTNINGLASIDIGSGTPVTGTFSEINWSTGTYFIKTETDADGGVNYDIVGVGQILSVPYSLYSENSKQQGKTTIILANDITDAEAAAQIALEAGPNTENIFIDSATQLTTIDLSSIKTLVSIIITNNPNLTTIIFSDLKHIYKEVYINNNTTLTSLNFSSLEKSYSGNFNITNNDNLLTIQFPVLTKLSTLQIDSNISLNSVTFPNLISASGGIQILNNNINSFSIPLATNINLSLVDSHTTNVDLPLLTNGAIYLNCPLTNLNLPSVTNCFIEIDNTQLTTINFPLLSSSAAIIFSNNNLLNSVSLPNLSIISGYLKIDSNAQLSVIELPLLSEINVLNQNLSIFFNVKNNALPSNLVNDLLNKLTTINIATGQIIDLSNQNPLAPPTGQGLTDKQTLVSNGFNVITD